MARIRDNQRRSRARRREYVQELEQRLRLCELQGIEATTEVQLAARRVAEENRQLRQLLHKHGFSDDYINRSLQASAAGVPDMNREQGYATGDGGMAAQALQQTMASRRPATLESNVPFSVPGQVLSDSSISSTPSVSSSAPPWGALPAESSYGHDQSMHLQTAGMAGQPPPPQQPQYSAALFMGSHPRGGPETYMTQPAQMGGMAPAPAMTQPMQQTTRGQIQYNNTINTYQPVSDGSYGDAPTGGWT